MKINHHLDESTLVSYVAGCLSQGMALVVATHISLCEKCRESVIETEAIGGALLEQMDSSEISDTSLESILSKLDEEPIAEPEKGLTDEPDGLVPPPCGAIWASRWIQSIGAPPLPAFACFEHLLPKGREYALPSLGFPPGKIQYWPPWVHHGQVKLYP